MGLNGRGTRRELSSPVVVQGQSGHFSACWSNGDIEISFENGSLKTYSAEALVTLEPSLVRMLSALMVALMPPARAKAKVRSLVRAAESRLAGQVTEQGRRMSVKERHRYGRPSSGVIEEDAMRAGVPVRARFGEVELQGVTPDGQYWRVNGVCMSLGQLAQSHRPLLVQLLMVVRPMLKNPCAFFHAVADAYPEVKDDPGLFPPTLPGRPRRAAVHGSYGWVRDALADPAPSRPERQVTPLNNRRVRHVR